MVEHGARSKLKNTNALFQGKWETLLCLATKENAPSSPVLSEPHMNERNEAYNKKNMDDVSRRYNLVNVIRRRIASTSFYGKYATLGNNCRSVECGRKSTVIVATTRPPSIQGLHSSDCI